MCVVNSNLINTHREQYISVTVTVRACSPKHPTLNFTPALTQPLISASHTQKN